MLLTGPLLGYGVAVAKAPSLETGNGEYGWWYPRDAAQQVRVQRDGEASSTVPIRSGHQQGFAVTVNNPSDWTQTVLGASAGVIAPGGPGATIGVSTVDPNGRGALPTAFVLPGVIPPHQFRMLRVLWTFTACLMVGGSQGMDTIALRVRVGSFTRTEVVPLDQSWDLSGPSQGPCH